MLVLLLSGLLSSPPRETHSAFNLLTFLRLLKTELFKQVLEHVLDSDRYMFFGSVDGFY